MLALKDKFYHKLTPKLNGADKMICSGTTSYVYKLQTVYPWKGNSVKRLRKSKKDFI